MMEAPKSIGRNFGCYSISYYFRQIYAGALSTPDTFDETTTFCMWQVDQKAYI
jgi:hypothetical protein